MDYRFAPGTNNFGFDRSVWDEIIRPILPSLDNENGETETQHLDTVETQNDSEYNPYSGLPFEVGRRRQFHQMIQLLHEYHAGDLDPTGEENEDLNDWPLHRVNGRQYSYFDMLFGSVLPRGVEPLPRLDPFTYLNLVEHIKPYRYFNGDINPELYAFEQDKIFVYPGEYCALQFLNDPSSFLVEEYFANEGFCIVFSLYNNSEKKIGTICRLVGHQFYSNEININISVKGYAICEILNLKPLALALEDNVSTTKIYKATHKPENIDKTPFYNFKWSDSLTRRLYHLGDIKTRHYPYPFAQDLKLSLNEFINYMDSFYSTTLELNPTIMSDDPYKYFLESMRITPLNFDQQMEIMQNDNLLCRFRILSEYLAPGMSVYCINCTNNIASLNNISK
ncbi:hypothetical protein RF11_07969 [Thelohanellus kitauei]|uniref:Uncharacterized protein n=1 Tax=Thelohanellus kitauei TaxID=669202 RepID=A0A0C2N609_THEKT|nr:hypothetical protein RF11_07969 [Thelohanellus kitauei]